MKRFLLCCALPVVLATAASATPIPIQITGGSISFTNFSLGCGCGSPSFSPAVNLTTTTGALVGTTPGYGQTTWTYASQSLVTITPTLNLETAEVLGGTSKTDLILTNPTPTRIFNPGSGPSLDRIDGTFSGPLTLNSATLPGDFTVYAPFSGQITISDFSERNDYSAPVVFLNDYLLTGSGIAQLHFFNSCPSYSPGTCTLTLNNATYTFTPEPQTTYLFASSLAGGWLLYRRRRSNAIQ